MSINPNALIITSLTFEFNDDTPQEVQSKKAKSASCHLAGLASKWPVDSKSGSKHEPAIYPLLGHAWCRSR